MAPQILQWTTAECVQFLRQCAKQYSSTVSETELEIYVKNFEQNHVAGSTILTFSDVQWNVLIPSFGFGNFIRRQLEAKQKICETEMRRAFWNSGRKKHAGEHSEPTVKDMPSKLTITSFFQRQEKQPIIDEDEVLEETVATDSGISSHVPSIAESQQILTASNIERFISQLGTRMEGHSTLLFRRACIELYDLLQNNRSDTARRVRRLCPDSFATDDSCRMSLSKWDKRRELLAEVKFQEQLEYFVMNGALQSTRNTKPNPFSPTSCG
jgi:hypothetical protein